ncbi:flagellar hook-length control protein FliK [Ammoniphilus resinae]|uniref:Flagellar hook-length control protein FliK n=1 Tax=Ammoniphilus resinae TaxID=861532 RepID=A0ABS4GMK2_9BACL|nr:flagellar hook-length control protein FliK [Ammoniphilus resinae]MBP1931503.1 flagellar hook-length control protein FliK [Ammoniphilus resinae]
MAAIEMRVSPMGIDAQMGKGNSNQADGNLSFSALLTQMQQSSMLMNSNEALDLPLPEGIQEGSIELLNLPEMDEEDIENLMDSMLQVLTGLVPVIPDPTIKANAALMEDNLSSLLGVQEGMEDSGWMKKEFQTFFTQFTNLLRDLQQKGISLPQNVMQNIQQWEEMVQSYPQMAQLSNGQTEMIGSQLGKEMVTPDQQKVQSNGKPTDDPFNTNLLTKPGEGSLHGRRDGVIEPKTAAVLNPFRTSIANASEQVISTTAAETSLEEMNPDRSKMNHPIPTVPLSTAGFLRMAQIQPTAGQEMIHRENFVQDTMDFLISKMKITHLTGGSEARVTLYPEHLGQLDIKISIQQGQMIAQFITDTATGRDLVESQLASLRASLQQQGIQVDKLEVYQSNDSSFLNQQGQPQQKSGENKQYQQSGSNSEIRIDEEIADAGLDLSAYGADSTRDQVDNNIDFTA